MIFLNPHKSKTFSCGGRLFCTAASISRFSRKNISFFSPYTHRLSDKYNVCILDDIIRFCELFRLETFRFYNFLRPFLIASWLSVMNEVYPVPICNNFLFRCRFFTIISRQLDRFVIEFFPCFRIFNFQPHVYNCICEQKFQTSFVEILFSPFRTYKCLFCFTI